MNHPASVLPQDPCAGAAPAPARGAGRWHLPAVLAGGLLGVALQLQQAALWPWPAYAAALLMSLLMGAWLAMSWGGSRRARRGRGAAALLAGMLLLWGLCGLRATAFLAGALAPGLEGRDLQVTGVVAAMPQQRETGLRLRLAVESARLGGAPVQLPARIDLAWYAAGLGADAQAEATPVPPVRAGERWRLTVRLKAPHGGRNPHGFDYELWLWEQGVQATGYVRTSARLDALHGPPQRLAATWHYPVEQLRQHVRDAIVRRLAADGGEAFGAQAAARQRAAGVVVALVTGDQRAIDLDADIKVENWASL